MTDIIVYCSVEEFLIVGGEIVVVDDVRETLQLKLSDTERVEVVLVFVVIFHV